MLWFVIIMSALSSLLFFASIFLSVASKLRSKKYDNENKSLLSVTDSMIVIWSTDLKIFEPNEQFKTGLFKNESSVSRSIIVDIFGNNRNLKTYIPAELMVNALGKNGRYFNFTTPKGDIAYTKWVSKVVEVKNSATIIVSVGNDYTLTRQNALKLREQTNEAYLAKEKLKVATECADIGVMTIVRENLRYKVDVSPNGKRMLGRSETDYITLDELASSVYSVEFDNYSFCLNQLLVGIKDELDIEVKLQVEQDIYHNFLMKFKSTKDEYENIIRITCAFVDITRQREMYSLYDKSSYEDELTGLPNRSGFISEAEAYVERRKDKDIHMALIVMELLHMQKAIALFGMSVSDSLYKVYSESLQKLMGKRSVIGRVGTDEFAVLTEFENRKDTDQFIRDFRIVIEAACNDVTLPIGLKDNAGFSVGVCVCDVNDDIVGSLGKAKICIINGEKDTVCNYYDDSIEKSVATREQLQNDIINALKHNEFELYYQPKISFHTGKVLGAEALIRWHHPTRGVVRPDDFIPVAEQMGVISKIDEWGMLQACAQNKRWQNKGFMPIVISVNMSQDQLYKTDVISTLKNCLKTTNLSPEWIEVELTETMAIQDINRTLSILNEIKKLGIRISMDDFGTGYSSLSSLKILPIDTLKIDKSLVYDIEENETAKYITRAIVDLGKAMKLEVLAEGVETLSQSELLRSLGCDIAQGFYYGRPQSVADMERLYLKKSFD